MRLKISTHLWIFSDHRLRNRLVNYKMGFSQRFLVDQISIWNAFLRWTTFLTPLLVFFQSNFYKVLSLRDEPSHWTNYPLTFSAFQRSMLVRERRVVDFLVPVEIGTAVHWHYFSIWNLVHHCTCHRGAFCSNGVNDIVRSHFYLGEHNREQTRRKFTDLILADAYWMAVIVALSTALKRICDKLSD